MSRQRISILGATGSIGLSTLDVLQQHPDRYEVYALGARNRHQALLEQCLRHRPRFAVLREPEAARRLADDLTSAGLEIRVLSGEEGLQQIASDVQVDTVMAAIVGAAGLGSSLAAARAGKRLLLANKEALVMAGDLFMNAVRKGGGELLPIDSEHNAVFQCLPAGYRCGETPKGIRRILLTASGGPFLNTPPERLAEVTPEQAVAHPNWVMGRKISVDSATLMNKGLEFIEACCLFGLRPDQVEVVVHPQSIVHSMVEYQDGSTLAQLGCPDMRTPIAAALAWPERIESGVGPLDLVGGQDLQFFAPDLSRFPCLRLAIEAASTGRGAPTILNAANEVAVDAFLEGTLRFDRIAKLITGTIDAVAGAELVSLDTVKDIDCRARDCARALLKDI